ncbi:MAG TPA: CehA/McbA family metallohydrolase, partial [Steroidobacteraceae bacterium]|nr:CehA/McbA family metallohydrolase [Steroidobacteraceae bacterium]
SDHIEIRTTMHNGGDSALPDLLSGLTLWPKGGFYFAVPGLAGVTHGKADGALADRAVAYDADWTIALHAPYLDHVGDGSRDLFLLHTLAPGETRAFDGWLQVGSSGDLAPVVRAEIDRKHLPAGEVRGAVASRDGKPVAEPVVVVEKQGKPYAWSQGHAGRYDLTLPAGDYVLYATAKNHSQSKRTSIHIKAGASATRSFHDLEGPGRAQLTVKDASGVPLDARIVIKKGQQPLVEFLGRKTFFTELDSPGVADLALAPGPYVLAVSSGGGFFSRSQTITLAIKPNTTLPAQIVLTRLFDPRRNGWFAADLHHHADQAEAVTPPADLARSQLAAGLDLLFVSDHDTTVNHAALQAIAARRGVPFIPSLELSPSWGHFNAYPLTPGQKLAIDTSTATVDQIFKEARRQGALVIQANHPYIPYGYFASVAAGVAPGGFNPGFDLVEINATVPDDDVKVLRKVWDFWNSGHHYFLTAGTDTHDVWNEESGRVRAFAHVEGKLTALSYAEALRDGHGYVSHGPLLTPDTMFGTTVHIQPGQPVALGFGLQSTMGLKQAQLVCGGTVLETRSFPDGPLATHTEFDVHPGTARWCSLDVEDRRGRRAYSDPVWIG